MSSPDQTNPPLPNEAILKRMVPLLCFTVFCSVLNGTMFNVAVPDIAGQFQLRPGQVSWVVTGYIAVFAMAATTYGKLVDLFPVRRLMTIGLLLFNFGALISLLSGWYPQLVIGRLIQAAGGGAIPALVMIIATRLAPPDIRGRVLGAVAATVAFGMGMGPLVGGLLAGSLHWRWLFVLSFATLLVLRPIRSALPREVCRPGHFDLPGALLLCLVTLLLLQTMTGGTLWSLLLASVCGGMLIRHLRRAPAPFLPPALWSNTRFRIGLLVTGLTMGSVFGLLFAIPLMLRDLLQLGTLSIGLTIFPGAICASLVGLAGGRFTDRFGTMPATLGGLGLLFTGYLMLGWWAAADALGIALLLLLSYAGFALVQPALGKTVSLTLSDEDTGVGMGLYNLTYFLSGAAGTAAAGGLIDWVGSLSGQPPSMPYRSAFFAAAITAILAAVIFRQAFSGERP